MMVQLKDLCQKASSNIAQKDLEGHDGQYPIYGASGLIGYVDFYKQERPYVAVVKDGAGIGRVMMLPEKSSVIGTMQYILPNKNVDVQYLAFAMEHMNLAKYFSGATIPHIYFKDYCKESLPEHTSEEQKTIAAALSKTDSLISLRRQQLSKLDELVKARFVEMFGDPYINNKHYPMRKGESFFKLSNGKTVPEDNRLRSGVPAYGGNGISWYTSESLFDNDTIVIGRVGFQSGNVHIAKGPLWITDNAMYVSSCDFDQYNLIFLINLMEHIDFKKFQDAGDLKKITQKPFMQYEYLCPPLPLQNQFAAFVERVDQQKQTVQQSLEKLELMKKALMQEYFG